MKNEDVIKPRACDICGSIALKVLHKQYFLFPGLPERIFYNVVTCQCCGFCYASEIPDQSIWNQFYQVSEHHLHTELPLGLARIHQNFFEFVLANCDLHKSSRILDIGTGMGHFLNHFKASGYNFIQGVEPSAAAARLARETYDLDVRTHSIDSLDSNDGFDFISLCGVLEHICDLNGAIKKISGLIKSQGYLFIAVPDVEKFDEKKPAEPFLEFALEHINFFSKVSLDNLLVKFGLEKVSALSVYNDFYDNSYILSIYRKVNKCIAGFEKDSVASVSLEGYIALSKEALRDVQDIAESLVSTQEPVIIWGAGALTSRLLCDTSLLEANIYSIVDRNVGLQGKKIKGLAISDPDAIKCLTSYTVLVASTTYANEIKSRLLDSYNWLGRIITLG